MCVYMRVLYKCSWVYVCMCMCTHVHVYACVSMYVYAHVNVTMFILHMCLHRCTYVHMHLCVHVCTYYTCISANLIQIPILYHSCYTFISLSHPQLYTVGNQTPSIFSPPILRSYPVATGITWEPRRHRHWVLRWLGSPTLHTCLSSDTRLEYFPLKASPNTSALSFCSSDHSFPPWAPHIPLMEKSSFVALGLGACPSYHASASGLTPSAAL